MENIKEIFVLNNGAQFETRSSLLDHVVENIESFLDYDNETDQPVSLVVEFSVHTGKKTEVSDFLYFDDIVDELWEQLDSLDDSSSVFDIVPTSIIDDGQRTLLKSSIKQILQQRFDELKLFHKMSVDEDTLSDEEVGQCLQRAGVVINKQVWTDADERHLQKLLNRKAALGDA